MKESPSRQRRKISGISHLCWVPFVTLFYREIRRFMRVMIQTILSPLVNSTLYLLIFGVSLGSSIVLKNGVVYLAFLIPGLVMMSCLNNAFQNTSSSVVSAKFAGELEDFRVSPLSNFQIIWALSLGGWVRGLLVGGVTWMVGEVFFLFSQRSWLPVFHPVWLVYFLTVGGLVFAQIGIMVAFWARTFDQMSAVSGFILTPLMYLGGVFFSIESLTPFWRNLSLVNPLLYLINGVRYGLVGAADVSVLKAALVSALCLLISYSLTLVSLKKGSFLRW